MHSENNNNGSSHKLLKLSNISQLSGKSHKVSGRVLNSFDVQFKTSRFDKAEMFSGNEVMILLFILIGLYLLRLHLLRLYLLVHLLMVMLYSFHY